MSNNDIRPKTLVLGPGESSRGGVASVIAMHQRCASWDSNGCIWLPTMDGGSYLSKAIVALKALLHFVRLLPGARVVHLHLALEASLYRKFLFFSIARTFKKTTFVHLHCPDTQFQSLMERGGGLAHSIYKFMLEGADRVIVLSPAWERRVLKYLPQARTCCLNNPYYLPGNFRAGKRTGKTVSYLSRVEPRKGYAELLRAIPAVLTKCPDTRFIMAGNGDIEAAKKLATELKINHAVEFPGWVEGAAKWQLLADSDILCLPSFQEGVPVTMLEAMGAEIAVVTTPVGGITDVIEDGENGLLVVPGDVHSIADALIRLLSNRHLLESIARAGRGTVERKNSLEVIDNCLGRLYSDAQATAETKKLSTAHR